MRRSSPRNFFRPIFTIPGRTFPVEVMYTKEPKVIIWNIATTVMQIHLTEPPGDILLFLTGQEDRYPARLYTIV